MEFSILGPLEAEDGGTRVDLGGGKQKALLGLLLLQAGRVVPMDRLIDGLWGEEVPESAPKMVQIFVSQLRKQLPRELIRTRSPGYLLDLDGHTLDLHAFEALHARGREALADGRSEEAARELRRGLDLWRGVPLAEFAEPFARPEEARLVEQQLACLEDRVDAELALGREAELVRRARCAGPPPSAPGAAAKPADAGALPLRPARRGAGGVPDISPERSTTSSGSTRRRGSRSFNGECCSRTRRSTSPRGSARRPSTRCPPRRPSSPARPPPAESRKLATVVVADVGPIHAPDDPEAQRAAQLDRTRAAEQELTRHGASVAGFGGGRVLGVFGVPTAQDDDALRAVTAAVALRSSSLAARVGLSTGEVVTGDPLVAGTPVDEAARLQERANAGDVLASPRTWRAVRHAVEASQREDGWAVDTVDTQAAPLVRRLETPLVGRERELHEIAKSVESAVGAGRPGLVTVFGAPGLGKTRLAAECVDRLQGVANAAVTHCKADGRDDTYAPLRELLNELADGDPAEWLRRRLGTDDTPRLADQLAVAVGFAKGTAQAEDAALATRRLLAGLADERPLLLVVEDVHWAAPAFLDLVESVVELSHAPILVLCLARPDLLDLRPHWGGGRVSSSTLLLDALPAPASAALLDLLSSDRRLDASARTRILETAEGNPLFIEQLLAAELEGDLATLPDSIQMLLAARLDRLDEADRAVIQAAAVCGTSFTSDEVSALVGEDVAASLVTLVRRELIRPGEAEDVERGGWSFRHALVRDVAYAGVPKWRRAAAARASGRARTGGGRRRRRLGGAPPLPGVARAPRDGRGRRGRRPACTAGGRTPAPGGPRCHRPG